MTEFSRSRESKLRLNVLVEIHLRSVVSSCWVVECCNAETVICLFKSI